MIPSSARGAGLHPLVIAVLALPALIAVLAAGRPWCAVAAIAACLVLAFVRGPRTGVLVAVSVVALGAIVWTGMRLWLPGGAALGGALRIVGTGALLTVPMLYVDSRVVAETLIDRFRVPYRIIDAAALGGRFAVLMRQDLRMALGLTTLRASGNLLRRARMWPRAALAVLVATFRHGDDLAIAMDARGFGMHPQRTVRCSRPVNVIDLGVLAAVWTASIALALVLERM